MGDCYLNEGFQDQPRILEVFLATAHDDAVATDFVLGLSRPFVFLSSWYRFPHKHFIYPEEGNIKGGPFLYHSGKC